MTSLIPVTDLVRLCYKNKRKRGDSPHGLRVKQVQTRTDRQPYLPSPSLFCVLLVSLHTDESKSVCIYCSTPTPKGITGSLASIWYK